MTDTYSDALSDLLEIYEQVGRMQPSLAMYKELLVNGHNLTQILAASYKDVILMNTWLVRYFQQRRKTPTGIGFNIILTTARLDGVVCHNLEAAQIKVLQYHRSYGISL